MPKRLVAGFQVVDNGLDWRDLDTVELKRFDLMPEDERNLENVKEFFHAYL